MAQPPRNSIPLLALAGLGSALFTLVVASAGFSERISVGFIFGIALAAYFVWYEGYRDSAKMAAFVGACTVAFPAALSSVVPLMIVFQVHVSMVSGKVDTPMPVFFGAGCIGALIVLAAGILLIGSQRVTRNFLGVIVFGPLAAGS